MHFLDLWVQDGDTVTIRGNSKYSFDWVVTSTNPMQQEQTAYNDAAKKVYREIARQDTLIWKLTVRQHMASGSQAQRLKVVRRVVSQLWPGARMAAAARLDQEGPSASAAGRLCQGSMQTKRIFSVLALQIRV